MFGNKRGRRNLIYADPLAEDKPRKPRRRGLWALAAVVMAAGLVALTLDTLSVTIQGEGQRYQSALSLMEQKQYAAAEEELAQLEDFRDSAAILARLRTNEEIYADALELMDGKFYDEAIAAFQSLGDYADAPEKLDECCAAAALLCLEAGDPDAAMTYLEKMSLEAGGEFYQEFMTEASGD